MDMSEPAIAEIEVRPPPLLPRPAAVSPLARLAPVVMVVATIGMMVFYLSATGPGGRNPMFALFPLMMLTSVIGTMAYNGRGGKRTAEINDDRRDYLRHLSDVDREAAKVAAAQRLSSHWRHPEPQSLWTLVGGDRMWNRPMGTRDYGQLRVGVATLPLAARFTVHHRRDPGESDPVTVDALRAVVDMHTAVDGLAVTVDAAAGGVAISGDRAAGRAAARALVCQLATFHAPEDVLIAAVVDQSGQRHWDWLKWLPHHRHPTSVDACGPTRLTFASGADVAALWRSEPPGAHVVVLVDGGDASDVRSLLVAQRAGAVTVFAVGMTDADSLPDPATRLHICAGELVLAADSNSPVRGSPDAMTVAEAAAMARRLARCGAVAEPNSIRQRQQVIPAPGGSRWQDLVGLDDPGTFDVVARWRAHDPRHRLRIPIGVAADGTAAELDIKEAAEGGHGPHGLCVGATGSGKSELLRTLVLGLATRHAPDELNLVLVDFKGGATFLGLESLAHVAAVITNLADEAPLVARMRDALSGEMCRRQELLRSTGHAGVAEYERARADGARNPPLPALFIVVDEFSELLSHHPELAELFAAVGRVGRSLRMHLLLASQRLDEGRMRGLETHLSYRICLKTFSASESRAAIGVSDAYELPPTPGAGYLRLGAGDLIRFDAAYVSGPYRPHARAAVPRACGDDAALGLPRLFTAAPVPVAASLVPPQTGPEQPARSGTVLQAVVNRLRGNGVAAHRVWLPPLGASPALSSLLVPTPAAPGNLLPVPIGVIDCPFEQRRTPLVVDVAGASGHVAVVGAPQSGKSTVVRTLISALGLTHHPGQVQFYCLDFGGGGLSAVRGMPHVGVVATRLQADLVRRTVAEMEAVVRRRERTFAALGVDSMADYRRRTATTDPSSASDAHGDVFLIVDGWAALRQEYDDLEGVITALAARGLSYGLHVVVTASRWAELRPSFKDLIGTRIELRLGDPADSEMDRKQARLVADLPGRGLNRDGKLTAIALPRLDGASTTDRLGEAADVIEATARRRWGERTAPPVRLLPTHIDIGDIGDIADIAHPGEGSVRIRGPMVIGLSERDLRAATVEFDDHPHLIIIGDVGSGKTAALRTLCRQIVARNTGSQAQLMLVDLRRTLLSVVDGEHLLDYAIAGMAVASGMSRLRDLMTARLPGAEVSQRQLRDRSWWVGPDIYLVVDDYDLVATAAGNPLASIVDLLPHARDVGLHLIVARRSGGAARAMYEPVLARLRESGAMGMLLSASPEEGMVWHPVRPSPLPPGRATLVTRSEAQLIQVAWTAE